MTHHFHVGPLQHNMPLGIRRRSQWRTPVWVPKGTVENDILRISEREHTSVHPRASAPATVKRSSVSQQERSEETPTDCGGAVGYEDEAHAFGHDELIETTVLGD